MEQLMKSFSYRFDTLSSFVERNTGLKVAAGARPNIIGLNLRSTLRLQFGTGAKRLHPLGTLMVLPEPVPPFPYQELPDDPDFEPDWLPEIWLG